MGNIEKIRQEIEFLKDLNEGLYTEGDNSYYEGHDNGLNHILAFIDSLPEEDTTEDLNELIQKWDRIDINTILKVKVKASGKVIDGFYDGLGHFDHFIDHDVFDRYSIDEVELMPEEHFRDSTKMISKDLEEAADEYSEKHGFRVPYDGSNNFYDEVDVKASKKGFIAGAKWQAKQFVKGSPLPEDTVLFQKGVEEGRRLERDDLALTWQDIRRIVKIADDLLDDPKARVAFQNHNEEYYYKRVLDEYNKLHKAEAE